MRVIASLALASAVVLGAPAAAQTPPPVPMKCPIGGADFMFQPTASSTVRGTRGDGRPYGTGTYPLALPECPDNGLVLYKDYGADEIAKLEPIVASEDYQGLRLLDTQYYRAYRLMKAMGLPPERHLWALLQASWEADGKPLLRARYLSELAEESAKAPARPDDINWIGMEGRAVNALRELGRFDEAKARLEAVPLEVLRGGAGTAAAAGNEAKAKRAWLDFFETQRALIARSDESPEPLELMPRRDALALCNAGKNLEAHQQAWCEASKSESTAEKAQREAEELETIRKSRAR